MASNELNYIHREMHEEMDVDPDLDVEPEPHKNKEISRYVDAGVPVDMAERMYICGYGELIMNMSDHVLRLISIFIAPLTEF
ncbi:hypothetical protein Z517_09229 [Fonsecaea pedrosoi CBS 271.37]|uniref:Uncharacterized protein n=1 Tax=Fonsecaea pedrosoi CBS 271.37 TaxID=1442368 RepID=A0A0D2GDL1_9EURO|nr:uncharacterized protein Z517_09229 [Fonsecaea pedrosoi CBS 271.37]KIW76785.1 hypothetical protein Z517_09229 [Fonsecaea pedrosoi CBS 271.37]